MSETTTVKVSRRTLKELERLRDRLALDSIEAAVRLLVRENRRRVLEKVFGADRERLTRFTEADRGEDRS